MAVHLNIGSQSAITYRMDCFDTDSKTDYNIYNPNVVVSDAKNDQDNYLYDVGYYSRSRSGMPVLSNHVICNNLIFTSLSDIYYKELKFNRSIIAINWQSITRNGGTAGIGFTVSSDTFGLFNTIYVDINSKKCYATGIQYENGTGTPYDDIFNDFNQLPQEQFNKMSLLLDFSRGISSGDNLIVNPEQLQNLFTNGEQYSAFWSQILQCEYGALFCRDTSVMIPHPLVIRCRAETESGITGIYDFPYGGGGWARHRCYIFPFNSQDEYNAAYAANYVWNSNIEKQIEKYYYNKFK